MICHQFGEWIDLINGRSLHVVSVEHSTFNHFQLFVFEDTIVKVKTNDIQAGNMCSIISLFIIGSVIFQLTRDYVLT